MSNATVAIPLQTYPGGMNTIVHSYKELIVWQRATELAIAVYHLTREFPREEQYGLISQMRRASVSIASNIAEGRHRGTRKDFLQFLRIAYASAAELETQLYISEHIPILTSVHYIKTNALLLETTKMLNSMIQKLKLES